MNASHTADVAELLAADRWDLAAELHEALTPPPGATDLVLADHALAGVLLEAAWDTCDAPPTLGAPHTAGIADMLIDNMIPPACSFHVAHTTAELEREELGADVNLRDLWMAGELLEAVCQPFD